jgi:hypothetical protein
VLAGTAARSLRRHAFLTQRRLAVKPLRLIVLATLALSAAATAAHADGPFGATVLNQHVRGQFSVAPKQYACKVSWDPTPNSGPPREMLSSTQCAAPAGAHKKDPCFCVVPVNGQPYAAAGKVAELLPGGGYSW